MNLAATACAVAGCGQIATKFPILLVWAKGFLSQGVPPAEIVFNLPVCDACIKKGDVSGSTLVDDNGWDQIVRGFEREGRPAPDRQTLQLRFDPIAKWHGELRR